jgi:hypothetical protein
MPFALKGYRDSQLHAQTILPSGENLIANEPIPIHVFLKNSTYMLAEG